MLINLVVSIDWIDEFFFICADLDMAVAYWKIVLHDKFKYLDLWSRYLVVSVNVPVGCNFIVFLLYSIIN